ncbi:SHOCT domain-containing protein [Wukongibacter baidiensis]|uniref:SHOCT domain-containing protein n=1 Tax=Wukongibacter baidiensis TaxID=1723361 RepID=UPI003D7FD9E3
MCGFWGYGVGGSSWMWMVGFGLVRLLIIAAVILWITKFVVKNNRRHSNFSNNALNILHERYINGEIDEEEYLRKKKVLDI